MLAAIIKWNANNFRPDSLEKMAYFLCLYSITCDTSVQQKYHIGG